MCFYYCRREICDNCGEELSTSTIKKRNCRKKSCDKTVKPGARIKAVDRTIPDMTHSCHFPLVISTEEDKMKKTSEERLTKKEQEKSMKESMEELAPHP